MLLGSSARILHEALYINGTFVEWMRNGYMNLNLFIVTNVWESPRQLDTWELCENSITGTESDCDFNYANSLNPSQWLLTRYLIFNQRS